MSLGVDGVVGVVSELFVCTSSRVVAAVDATIPLWVRAFAIGAIWFRFVGVRLVHQLIYAISETLERIGGSH